MPMIVMVMPAVPTSMEDTTACVTRDTLGMEKTALTSMSVQATMVDVTPTPHVTTMKDHLCVFVNQDTLAMIPTVWTLMNAP